jgi:Bacterial protein of unknown function (DUF882)
MDFYIPGVPIDQLRAMGLRLQRGGVGFYPTSGSPFVHMDTGGVRMWPRMTREQLVRVFPDQRTIYIPSDGRPLAGYDLALADIKKRGGNSPDVGVNIADAGAGYFHPLTKLLHLARGGDDEEEADGNAGTPRPTVTETVKEKAKAAVATTIDRAEDKLAAGKARLARVAARAKDKLAAEKAKLAKVATQAEEKLAAEKAKLTSVAAKAHAIPSAEAAPFATTPNQIILARGFWQGAPDGMPVARPSQDATHAIAAVARPRGVEVASADDTPSIDSPRAAADRDSTESALGYAADRDASAASSAATAGLRTALMRAAGVQTGENETSVAVAGVTGRPASTIVTVAAKKVATVLADVTRLSDPWLRAILVSPSVNHYLCVTVLGVRDFRPLAGLMVKPASSVMMSFAADPNPGLTPDHFSGSAVSFTPIVNYALRTAALQ